MVFLGYTAKGILILGIVIGVFLIFEFLAMNQTVLATLILAGLIIPIALVAFEYQKSFREFQCNNCKHNFTVSHLRLLFTVKFRGKDPVPTGTVAYLKCPNCNERDWRIPSG